MGDLAWSGRWGWGSDDAPARQLASRESTNFHRFYHYCSAKPRRTGGPNRVISNDGVSGEVLRHIVTVRRGRIFRCPPWNTCRKSPTSTINVTAHFRKRHSFVTPLYLDNECHSSLDPLDSSPFSTWTMNVTAPSIHWLPNALSNGCQKGEGRDCEPRWMYDVQPHRDTRSERGRGGRRRKETARRYEPPSTRPGS